MLNQLDEQDKAIIRKAAEDMKFKTIEPILNKIFVNSFGINVSAERFQGWKDVKNMFKEALEKKE